MSKQKKFASNFYTTGFSIPVLMLLLFDVFDAVEGLLDKLLFSLCVKSKCS